MAVLIKVDVWEMLTDGFFTPEVLKTFDIHMVVACSSPSQISQCPTDRSITVVTYSLTRYKMQSGYRFGESTKPTAEKKRKENHSKVPVRGSAMVDIVSMENGK